MFEWVPGPHSTDVRPAAVTTADLKDWLAGLAVLNADVSDAERIEQLRALEELKSAAAAAQVRVTADLDESVRAERAARGVPATERGRGIGAQVALARRESPNRGGRHLGFARALVTEMPHTLAALSEGSLSEWRATLLVRETACLSREDRGRVDAELCADPATLAGLGDRAVADAARRAAYRLDPQAAVARANRAESERGVTLRPAPETMSYLTGLLPVPQGVAAYAALSAAADEARAAGDPRSRGQVMADTLGGAGHRPSRRRQHPGHRQPGDDGAEHAGRRRRAGRDRRLRLRSPPAPPATCCVATPRSTTRPRRPGFGACSPIPPPVSWSPCRPRQRPSRLPCASCSSSVTRPAAPRGATLPSAMPTTPADGPTVARPPPATVRASASSATTSRKSPGWAAAEHATSGAGHHVVQTSTPTGHRYRSRPPPLPGARLACHGARPRPEARQHRRLLHRAPARPRRRLTRHGPVARPRND